MIAPNFEVQMLNQTWRLITGAVLGILSVGVISNRLNYYPAEILRRTELFLLLTLWVVTTAATLGILIYYDLRQSLREPMGGLASDESRDVSAQKRGRNV